MLFTKLVQFLEPANTFIETSCDCLDGEASGMEDCAEGIAEISVLTW